MPYKISTFSTLTTLFLILMLLRMWLLTQLLKEEGVADIQAYKDFYVPMNKALWKDLEQKKISKQELVNTRFSRLFVSLWTGKDGSFLAQQLTNLLAQQGQTFFRRS